MDQKLENRIFLMRGQKVMLDIDLAEVYGVSTKRLNEQIKRNKERFPKDFMFRLTEEEKAGVVAKCDHLKKLKFSHILPIAFSEHGAIMAANVLRSRRAVKMSIFVVRAFVKMRERILDKSETERRFLEIERVLLGHNENICDIYEKIAPLLSPFPGKSKKQIGFTAKEKIAAYGAG